MDTVDSSPARKKLLQSQLAQANAALPAEIRDEKYQALEGSPFAFFRGTNHLYYRDIQAGVIAIPPRWAQTAQIETWISGDLHPQNLGYLTTKDDVVVLDLNDPDESYVAPFYLDLVRMVAGISLLRDEVGFDFSRAEAQKLAFESFLSEYESALSDVSGNARETTLLLDASKLSGFVKEKAQALTSQTNLSSLKKWTKVSSGVRRFDFNNPKLAECSAAEISEIDAGMAAYATGLGEFGSSRAKGYFNVKDRAVRVHSGLGSLGLKKYYVLLEGPTSDNDDDVLLELKRQQLPTMLSTALSAATPTYASQFASHGERALTAWKALLNKVDDHAGYLENGTKSYLVRRISRAKFSFEAGDYERKADLANFLKYAARATAYAHARSDRDYDKRDVNHNFERAALSALEAWPAAKRTMAELGEAYADQVQADYALFVELRAEGEL